jgi:hypothetical protein
MNKCPIKYDYNNCSSKEYGNHPCETCCHYDKERVEEYRKSEATKEKTYSSSDTLIKFFTTGTF